MASSKTKSVSKTMGARRILHVVRRMDVSGGAERLISELVRSVDGHRVLVFDGGESFYDLGLTPLRVRGYIHAVLWLLIHGRRFDVIHLHLFPAIYLSVFLGRRCVIHEHNTDNRRRKYPLFSVLERFVYRRARAVIAISVAAAESLERWVGVLPKLHVLPNFVPDLSQNVGGLESDCGLDSISGVHTHLVMVASLTSKKNHAFMLDVLAQLPPNYLLHLVGDGPLRGELVNQAKALGIDSRVRFHGAVRNVARFYSFANLCVLTSSWEGFGLVAIEAAQFGVPTVVPDIAGLRDFLPDKRFIVHGRDPKEWAASIISLRTVALEGDIRTAYRNAARAFSIDAYLASLYAVYE